MHNEPLRFVRGGGGGEENKFLTEYISINLLMKALQHDSGLP